MSIKEEQITITYGIHIKVVPEHRLEMEMMEMMELTEFEWTLASALMLHPQSIQSCILEGR